MQNQQHSRLEASGARLAISSVLQMCFRDHPCDLLGPPTQVINSANYIIPNKKGVLHHNHFRYLHKTNTIAFIMISAMKWTKFHHSCTFITKVGLFGNVIYSSAEYHLTKYTREVDWDVFTTRPPSITDIRGLEVSVLIPYFTLCHNGKIWA